MPYTVSKSDACPASRPWAVTKTTDGKLIGCHETKQGAQRQLAALMAKEEGTMTETQTAEERAQWTTAYINDLPDSAFLYIAPGGSKDADGKTTPRSLRYFPYKDSNGNIDLPHLRNALARIPQSTLPGAIKERVIAKAQRILENQQASVDQDGLLRFAPAADADLELRYAEDEGMPTLAGHFAVFDQWTEISSTFEGTFLERLAPGAFKKTFAENRSKMRVLFQHGRDPQIGEKILGAISELREDDRGAYYEVPLFDTSYNRELLPALRSNAYGSSFRFKVMQEQIDERPERSEHNPDALTERTIVEAKVFEFGPVTFPAYEGTTTGLRSATDWWREQSLISLLRLTGERAAALPPLEPAIATPAPSRRTRTARDYLNPNEEVQPWRL
jgi:HK97 family phage prohead protease